MKLLFKGKFIMFIVLLFVILIGYSVVYYNTSEIIEITIKDKERITEGKRSKYLIYTENEEVFQNTDSFLFLKFNSSDLYGKLDKTKTYKVKIVGWRIPFLSMYRNIIEIEE